MAKRRVLDEVDRVPKVIGRNAVYMGRLESEDGYLVHGEVYGDSDIQGILMLAQDCHWKGTIVADSVIVKGSVEGDITARNKLELRDTAKVVGNLKAPLVAISHEAYLRGEVHEDCLVTHFPERRAH
ncbi:MAG: polymer-forming cytoskeletal protein [Gammaproteobacteria bacterium]|nr:polymer-forming cytoskeletal protein [Gammaproteobacteria bacterium]